MPRDPRAPAGRHRADGAATAQDTADQTDRARADRAVDQQGAVTDAGHAGVGIRTAEDERARARLDHFADGTPRPSL